MANVTICRSMYKSLCLCHLLCQSNSMQKGRSVCVFTKTYVYAYELDARKTLSAKLYCGDFFRIELSLGKNKLDLHCCL